MSSHECQHQQMLNLPETGNSMIKSVYPSPLDACLANSLRVTTASRPVAYAPHSAANMNGAGVQDLSSLPLSHRRSEGGHGSLSLLTSRYFHGRARHQKGTCISKHLLAVRPNIGIAPDDIKFNDSGVINVYTLVTSHTRSPTKNGRSR